MIISIYTRTDIYSDLI